MSSSNVPQFLFDDHAVWKYPQGCDVFINEMLNDNGIRMLTGEFAEYKHRVYRINDNGGEICLQLVNVWPLPINIPSSYRGMPSDPEEFAAVIVGRILRGMQSDGEGILFAVPGGNAL